MKYIVNFKVLRLEKSRYHIEVEAENGSGSRFSCIATCLNDGHVLVAFLEPFKNVHKWEAGVSHSSAYIAKKYAIPFENEGDLLGVSIIVASATDASGFWHKGEFHERRF